MNKFNPIAVLICSVILLIPLLITFDPITPLLYIVFAILMYSIAGLKNPLQYGKTVLVFSLLALSLVVINIIAPNVQQKILERSLAIYLRSLGLIMVSIGYFYVISPYDVVYALMQTAGLSPRIGFSLFAGWNTVPLFIRDMNTLKAALAFRYGRKKIPFRTRLFGAIILLSHAVRHGERASLSMAVRGIDSIPVKKVGSRKQYLRSSVKKVYWTFKDTILCIAVAIGSILLLLISIQLGWFKFELG
ncbi:MAG TPA: energy-coupling factor transporter transmembrane component T [Spirochaetia bacterium]|nr:energy-coupling factor transporter transmembrane component T [Spirochaetales bacterium]HQK33601.1 energy-coupling factor transporter transmembrane component T [Spirochaetales bacterium]HRS65090.1 energy-coupling factor transporter transmembrane component T [Spirochaetia bacterium]HRV28217.1 energy-coupling factor transporter transmembrane component T [Spirochaetia bacterium]